MKTKLSAAIVVISASLLSLPVPASAAQMAGFTKNLPERASGSGLVQKVRRRRRRGRRRRGRGNAGAAAAGAIFGFALGSIIADQAARHRDAVEWCLRRYRSYDPETGTWIDNKGRVRRCP